MSNKPWLSFCLTSPDTSVLRILLFYRSNKGTVAAFGGAKQTQKFVQTQKALSVYVCLIVSRTTQSQYAEYINMTLKMFYTNMLGFRVAISAPLHFLSLILGPVPVVLYLGANPAPPVYEPGVLTEALHWPNTTLHYTTLA